MKKSIIVFLMVFAIGCGKEEEKPSVVPAPQCKAQASYWQVPGVFGINLAPLFNGATTTWGVANGQIPCKFYAGLTGQGLVLQAFTGESNSCSAFDGEYLIDDNCNTLLVCDANDPESCLEFQ